MASVIEKWKQHGGARGEAIRIFWTEMDKALLDEQHPLYKAAQAHKNGDEEKTKGFVYAAMGEAVLNPDSILYQPAFFMVGLPLALKMADLGESFCDPKEETFFDMMRLGWVSFLSMLKGSKQGASSGGKSTSKIYASRDNKIISEWKEWKLANPNWPKKGSMKKFAREYIEQHKPSLSANRIVRIIGKFEKMRHALPHDA